MLLFDERRFIGLTDFQKINIEQVEHYWSQASTLREKNKQSSSFLQDILSPPWPMRPVLRIRAISASASSASTALPQDTFSRTARTY